MVRTRVRPALRAEKIEFLATFLRPFDVGDVLDALDLNAARKEEPTYPYVWLHPSFLDDDEIMGWPPRKFLRKLREVFRGKTNEMSRYTRPPSDEMPTDEPTTK